MSFFDGGPADDARPRGRPASDRSADRFGPDGLTDRFPAVGTSDRFAGDGLTDRFPAVGTSDRFAGDGLTDRFGTEQPTERIPVVRLPSGPVSPGRHSRSGDVPFAATRRRAGPTASTTTTSRVASQRPRRPGWRSLMWRIATTATAFTLLLALAAAGLAGYAYQKFNGQLTRKDVLQKHDPHVRNPARQQHAANFLVIGSDTRAGADAKYGNVAGARSDTTMLVHLSPDRAKATVISIPRDSWVDIPACTGADGNVVPEHSEMFNSAFSVGGPQCTIKTVQKLTGILVTHFVEIDFSGFESMVKAMGSITVCSPQSVSDPYSGLTLHPGQNQLGGEQALAFVRARETLGDGSDLGRIKRQQIFLGAVIRQAMSGPMLSNPARLTSFLNAATKAITVDKGTSFGDLRALATSMQGLDPRRVTFYTSPIADQNYTPPGTTMTGRVLLDDVDGRVLYDSVIYDTRPVWVKNVGGKSQVIRPTATKSGSATSAPGSGHTGATPTTRTPPTTRTTTTTTATTTSAHPIPTSSLNAAQQSCSL
ncbi:MAG: LytR family transcriptional regulator [Pseudonocardiales bacterium]|nr:MAG: LytR family transcriptional regulator [Pseudonocardiales bacterium]